jgi:hypothetical protein
MAPTPLIRITDDSPNVRQPRTALDYTGSRGPALPVGCPDQFLGQITKTTGTSAGFPPRPAAMSTPEEYGEIRYGDIYR